MTIIQEKNLSLSDIHRLFGFERQYNTSFTNLLSLESLTEFEQQELVQIQQDFDNYIIEGKVS